uniref:Uncharacterized protein n=1 Tax=Avena sativa TaxID=4498 RepID=A0ACD5YSR8_AVESA
MFRCSCFSMAGKNKLITDYAPGRAMPKANDRARNRASPLAIVTLVGQISDDQKTSIKDMGFGSMLDIKCHTLHNPVISWLAHLYDKHNREFVIPGRGRIPLDPDSVYRTLGLPRGEQVVRYGRDVKIEERIGPVLFPENSTTPKISEVFTMLKGMTVSDDRFKQLWIMVLVCTLLRPTTCNKVSNRVYPILDNFADIQNMNLCQFVCDKLHDELTGHNPSAACLFHLQLLYVDSLDVRSLNLNLPDGRFVVNIWTKANIEFVLIADLKRDGSGYGNLELKPHLATNLKFFGGSACFEQWIDTNTAPNCTKLRRDKVARLIGDFASGMTGLLGKLVQGWTEMDDSECVLMEEAFGNLDCDVPNDGAMDDATASNKTSPIIPGPSVHCSKKFESSPAVREMSDGGIQKLNPPELPYRETVAASTRMVDILTPISESPPVCSTKIADVSRAEENIIGHSARLEVPPFEPGEKCEEKCCPKSDDVPDLEGGIFDDDEEDNDDAHQYIIQRISCDVNMGESLYVSHTMGDVDDDLNNLCNHEPDCNDVVFSKLHKSTEISCLCMDGVVNDSEPEKTKHVPVHEEGSLVGCLAKSDSNVDDIGFLHFDGVKCGALVDFVDNSSELLGTNVSVDDFNQAPNQVQLANSVLMHDTKAPRAKWIKNRKLCILSSDGEASKVFPCQGPGVVEPRVQSYHRKQSKVVVKSILNDAVSTKDYRSSPCLQSTQTLAFGGNNANKKIKITTLHASKEDSSTKNYGRLAVDVEQAEWRSNIPPDKAEACTSVVIPFSDNSTLPSIEDKVVLQVDHCANDNFESNVHVNLPAAVLKDDVETIYVTPAMPLQATVINLGSNTPRTKLRMGRVVLPSKFLLPPYSRIVSTEEQDHLYQQVIKHHSGRKESKIKESYFLHIDPMWVYTGDLASSVMPSGQLSSTVAEVVINLGSNTPRTKLRMGRVVLPSKFLLPPYSRIVSTEEQDHLYQQVIKHHSGRKESKIKESYFLHIDPMWVYTGDLASSVMPSGQLSSTVAEVGIAVLQKECPVKKIIFPWIVTVYLLENKFDSKILRKHFRRDEKYKLSHQNLLSFAVLQELGTKIEPCGHWYTLFLNFEKKRFEVLDSARNHDDESLISHATSLVDAIKKMYLVNYSKSSKQIQDYDLEYIDVPKQNNKDDCGFFMLKFLELWNGRVVPAITYDQIPELRKVLTWIWLNHPSNKIGNWRYMLEMNSL